MRSKLLLRYASVLAAGVLAAFAAAQGGTSASAAAFAGNCTPESTWPTANDSLAGQALGLVNQHRAAMGLRQLTTSPTLSASAVWKARHMAAYLYMAHDDPAPPLARSAGERFAACGYTAGWGENIAEGFQTAASVVDAWLASPGHRANIENPSFVASGIGAAASNGTTFWAQDFGTVADGGQPPPPTTTTAPTTTTTPTTTAATTTTAPRTTTGTTTMTGTTTAPASTTAPPQGQQKPAAAALSIELSSPSVRRTKTRRLTVATHVAASGPDVRAAHIDVKCSATVGARRLRVVLNAFRHGEARCAWRIPPRLRHGVVVRGWVGVKQAGAHARQTFALDLR